MDKYFRVKQDTFLWKKGAILMFNSTFGSQGGGYSPIEDVWNTEANQEDNEWISKRNIEKNTEYFERVYKSGMDKFLSKAAAMLEFGNVVE